MMRPMVMAGRGECVCEVLVLVVEEADDEG